MAKFQFRLQNVLNIKEKLEEQKKMELSNAHQLLDIEEKRLEHLTALRDDNIKILRNKVGNKITVKDIRDIGESNQYYSNIIIQQDIVVAKANDRVSFIKKELKEALIEKKIYEKLKENAYAKYYDEECKEEQKHLDEIVSYRYKK
ncbi:hypothetical protein SH1V18_14660 [Vallitalea longa]|uniref:Flagellar FliJ protein n=1 Tax=Vallitalea longa TaxID=2936439 RepID=A0A9W5YA84_9FIRM|nr:flagellar export protein FliJ [Vallitalea longa]GKX28986.1 hypothetical protein SH1V18_14660 [Vallitalea longa]